MIGAGDKVAASYPFIEKGSQAKVKAAEERLHAATVTQIDKDIETVMEFMEYSRKSSSDVSPKLLRETKAAQNRLAQHLQTRTSFVTARVSKYRRHILGRLKWAGITFTETLNRYAKVRTDHKKAPSTVASGQGLRGLVGPLGFFALPIFFLMGALPKRISE